MNGLRFAADWLALREPSDAAARDLALVRRFATALPRNPRILDLGAGTGGNARAVAPLIGEDQRWLLIESDTALRAAQVDAMLAWAWRAGRRASQDDDGLRIISNGVAWRFLLRARDLGAGWAALDAEAADAVTAGAFLDLAGAAWIARFVDWLSSRRLPLLATLMVDGRRRYGPEDDEDATVAAAFRRHQGRDKGLGPALGPAAAETLVRVLAARGYAIASAASDWRLGRGDRDLLRELIRGEAAAAREAAPEHAMRIDGWERRRLVSAAAGSLGAVIGHRDVLALPREVCQNHRLR